MITMASKGVSVIVVNFNGEKYITACLRSLMNQTYDIDVILVDNASRDNSLELVEKNFPEVKIIRNDFNLGFARGVNLGIKQSNSKYIATLNNDAIADPLWIEELVKVMNSDKSIGICASKIFFMNKKMC